MNDYLVTKELYHHGIKGQKWGIRRYQNEDGTLTEAGRKRITEQLGKNNTTDYKLPKFIMRKRDKDNIKTYTFLRENNLITDSDVEKHKKLSAKSNKIFKETEKNKWEAFNKTKMPLDEYGKFVQKEDKKYNAIADKVFANIENLSVKFLSNDPDFEDKKLSAKIFLDRAMNQDDKYYKKNK